MKTRIVPDKNIKLILLQVSSGQENSVAQKISQHLSGERSEFRIYKAMGTYDLIVLTEKSVEPTRIYDGTIPNIINSTEFKTYGIVDGPNCHEDIFKRFDSDLIWISFIKLKREIYFKDGISPIVEFMDYLKSKKPGALIFGSLSWPDMVFIHPANDLNELLLEVPFLFGQIHYKTKRLKSVDPVTKTFSLVGIKKYNKNGKDLCPKQIMPT